MSEIRSTSYKKYIVKTLAYPTGLQHVGVVARTLDPTTQSLQP
jgi:hypothetical protein